jgi:hypothetical protein
VPKIDKTIMPTSEEVEVLVIESVRLLAEDFDLGALKQPTAESALYGKLVGEKSTMTITASEAGETFGHMRMQICSSLGIAKITEPFFLETTVTGVSQADNRELVQAIAKAASQGGCGGNCDCGC